MKLTTNHLLLSCTLLSRNLRRLGGGSGERNKLLCYIFVNNISNSTTASSRPDGVESSSSQLNVLDKYHQLIKAKVLSYDAHQFEVALQLNRFHSKLVDYRAEPLVDESSAGAGGGLGNVLRRYFKSSKRDYDDENAPKPTPRVKSIYLYGGVGCGKTMLMDLVYTMLPANSTLKQRIHFNKFMLNVHQRVHDVKHTPQHKHDDPLEVVANQLLAHTHVLFFDEFQVTDIADAMLMSRLFTRLFSRGLVVFFTSNRAPSELYKNGLQRELFMPFIDQIYHFCDVVCLDSSIDYRKRAHISTNRVYFNCDYETHLLDRLVRNAIKKQEGMQGAVDSGSDELIKLKPREIEVLGRKIMLERTYKRLLDTSFAFMCEEARSSVDYLELVKHFDVIILRDIPFISLRHLDILRRFIVFIDTLYDNHIKLLCSGKASSPQLLFDFESMNQGTSKEEKKKSDNHQHHQDMPWLNQGAVHDEHFALDRTISRLIDMQSENYHKNTVFMLNNKTKTLENI